MKHHINLYRRAGLRIFITALKLVLPVSLDYFTCIQIDYISEVSRIENSRVHMTVYGMLNHLPGRADMLTVHDRCLGEKM